MKSIFPIIATTILFSVCALNSTAGAAEGLLLGPIKPSLQRVWDDTGVIIVGTHGMLSAAIMGKETINGRHFIYVLTAGHAELSTGWPDKKPITPNMAYEPIHFYSNISVEPNSNELPRSNPNDKFPGNPRFVWGLLAWSELDAGIMIFEMDQDPTWLTPLTFSKSAAVLPVGTKTYLVGFPAVTTRDRSVQSIPFKNPETIVKRWSTGAITGLSESLTAYGSTNDNLEGMSGGPIVTELGEVLGPLSGGPNDNPENAYIGNEKAHTYQATFYPPRQVERFFSDSIAKFRKESF